MNNQRHIIMNSENKESIRRMMRALEKSINVYTEINLETMHYRQVNMKDSANYTAQPHGYYPEAYEMMCTEQIHPDDVCRVRETVSPEALIKGAENADEVSVRYRLKNSAKYTVMQSKILFIQDNGVNYAISIVSDVTKESISAEKKAVQDRLLNNIESGIINIEYIHGDFRVVAANSMICKLCGLTENEFTDMDEQTFISMASWKYRDALSEMLTCLKASSCKHELEYRIRSELAGENCWLYAIGNSIQMQDDVISVFITFYDISSTKEQEKIFQSNQKAVRLAQKRGNIAIWTYNIDEKTIIQQSPTDEVGNMGYPVYINDVPQTFIISKSIYPDDEKIFLDAYKKLDDNEESVDAVYRIMNNDTGKYDWVHMYYQRIYDNNLHRTALGFSVLVNRQQNQMEQYRTELQLQKQIFAKADLAVEIDLTQGIIIEMTGGMFTNTDVKYWNGKDFSEYYQYVYELVENEYKSEIEKLSAHNLLEMFQSGETRCTIEFLGRGTKDSPLLYYRSSAYITSNPFNGHVNAFIYTENVDDEVKYKQAIESSLDDGIESIGLIRVSDGVSRLIKSSRLMKCYEEGMTFVYDDDFVIKSCRDVCLEERDSYIKLG